MSSDSNTMAAKMLSDRPTDAVVSQLQGGAPGAYELPRKQDVERIPGELKVSARRRCRHLRLEIPWDQTFEGVEAGVDQKVKADKFHEPRFLHLQRRRHVRDMRDPKGQARGTVRPLMRFRLRPLQFSSSRRVLVQDKPGISDGADQRIGCFVRHPSHQSLSGYRLLAQVSRQGEHHGLGVPRAWRALFHYIAGPEEGAAFVLREPLLADRQRLSVQVGAGDSLDGDRQRLTVTDQAKEQIVVVVRSALKHAWMPANVTSSRSRRATSIESVGMRNAFDHVGNAAVDPNGPRINRAIRFDAIEKAFHIVRDPWGDLDVNVRSWI